MDLAEKFLALRGEIATLIEQGDYTTCDQKVEAFAFLYSTTPNQERESIKMEYRDMGVWLARYDQQRRQRRMGGSVQVTRIQYQRPTGFSTRD